MTVSIKPATFLVLFVLIAGAVALVSIPETHAFACTWNGGNGAWENPANWLGCTGGGIPTAPDTPYIGTSGVTITISTTQTVAGLAVALTADGVTLINSGTFSLTTSGLAAAGPHFTFENTGSFIESGLGVVFAHDSAVTNHGAFSVGNLGLIADYDFTLTNYGTFSVGTAGLALGHDSTVTNSGSFSSTGVTLFGAGSTFTNLCHGTVTGVSGITITNQACPPVGGFLEPVNKVAVFAPYLALFGLVATVAVVVVKPWKKTRN